jgi:hypothetical protein
MKFMPFVGALGVLAGAGVPAAGEGATAPCTERCYWNMVAYQCLAGSEGRNCIAQGTTCSIITSCGYTYQFTLPNGAAVATAEINGCGRSVVTGVELVLTD